MSWSDTPHFLLVTIDGNRMTVRAIGELVDGKLSDIPRRSPNDEFLAGPIEIASNSEATERHRDTEKRERGWRG